MQFQPNSKYEEERKKRNYLSACSFLLILLRLSHLILVRSFRKVRGYSRSYGKYEDVTAPAPLGKYDPLRSLYNPRLRMHLAPKCRFIIVNVVI